MAKRGSAQKPPPAEVDPDLLPPPVAPAGDEDIPPMGAGAAPPEPDAPPEPEDLSGPDAPSAPEALAQPPEPVEPVRAEDVLEPTGAQDRRRAAEVTPPTGRPARGRGGAATGSATAPSPTPPALASAAAAPKGAARIIQSGSGSYEVLRQLGEGGMAQVFHARRVGAAGFVREVALKRVHTCRWRYGAAGAVLHGECLRKCGRQGSQVFRNAEDAHRLARYLGRQETPVLERVLRPLARVVDGAGRQSSAAVPKAAAPSAHSSSVTRPSSSVS